MSVDAVSRQQSDFLGRLTPDTRRFYRDQLRDGRVQALSDAEDFQDLLFTFERLGSYLSGCVDGTLKTYGRALLALAADGQSTSPPGLNRLFDLVNSGRNDAFHKGDAARRLTTHATEFALLLEDGLMLNSHTVRDFMVGHPFCAEPWHDLRHVRRVMLEHSFSYLPYWKGDRWMLITDYGLAKYLGEPKRSPSASESRSNRR